MAEKDPQKVAAILQDYAETLEVLTINSKPLINDLTMAADRYKPLAPKIVEKIESRLFEVAPAFCPVLVSYLYAMSISFVWLLYNIFNLVRIDSEGRIFPTCHLRRVSLSLFNSHNFHSMLVHSKFLNVYVCSIMIQKKKKKK